MKKLSILVLAILLMAGIGAGVASAGSAYDASYTTSITYQNLSASPASVVFSFYPQSNGTAVTVSKTLAANSGASIFLGSVTEVSAGFNGSAVMSSNQPIAATLVQISSDGDVKNRPLSNGFTQGSSSLFLASVLKNTFGTTSRFSIQNAHTTGVDLTITLTPVSGTAIVINKTNLPVGSAQMYDMGTLTQITAAGFNGSATVTAVETGTSTPANIVGTVLELSTTGGAVSAFESIAAGANTVYMPSAICQTFGASTAYAVQNVGSASTSVTVTYSTGQTDVKTIAAGAKASFQGCDKLPAGTSGAATITAGSGGEIIAVAKVFGGALSAAFPGASSGSAKLALPYVRYSASQYTTGARQRAFIAIQNVGSALNAGDVTVKYFDKDGNLVATHTLGAMANGAKLNSNPSASSLVLASGKTAADLAEFGYVGGFGGGAIIEGPAGSQLVATVRVVSSTTAGTVGEDYTGITAP